MVNGGQVDGRSRRTKINSYRDNTEINRVGKIGWNSLHIE